MSSWPWKMFAHAQVGMAVIHRRTHVVPARADRSTSETRAVLSGRRRRHGGHSSDRPERVNQGPNSVRFPARMHGMNATRPPVTFWAVTLGCRGGSRGEAGESVAAGDSVQNILEGVAAERAATVLLSLGPPCPPGGGWEVPLNPGSCTPSRSPGPIPRTGPGVAVASVLRGRQRRPRGGRGSGRDAGRREHDLRPEGASLPGWDPRRGRVEALLAADAGREGRQVGIVDARAARRRSRKGCQTWAGGLTGKNCPRRGTSRLPRDGRALGKGFDDEGGARRKAWRPSRQGRRGRGPARASSRPLPSRKDLRPSRALGPVHRSARGRREEPIVELRRLVSIALASFLDAARVHPHREGEGRRGTCRDRPRDQGAPRREGALLPPRVRSPERGEGRRRSPTRTAVSGPIPRQAGADGHRPHLPRSDPRPLIPGGEPPAPRNSRRLIPSGY